MANIARITVEAKINKLMASYVAFKQNSEIYHFTSHIEEDLISEIVGLNIPPVSNPNPRY